MGKPSFAEGSIIELTDRILIYKEQRMRKVLLCGNILSAPVLMLISLLGLAGGETVKSPILDRASVVYSVPGNLEKLTLEELEAEKAVRVQDLTVIKQASDAPDAARQKLLKIIFEHDDKRLQIVKVIPVMIDDYQIEGEFRDALLGYSNTFDVEIRNARKHVHTLDDYKSYDFRFSAVYMSMMFKFSENSEFQKRMVADMRNPDTPIGRYRKELAESYAKVERNKHLLQDIYSIDELKNVIMSIDEEISRREHAKL